MPAGFDERFGFQSPACWVAVASLVAAVLVWDNRGATGALLLAEAALIAWYVWAAWLVTTNQFAQHGYPFVGADLIGSGWYYAGIGLLVAAGSAAKRLFDHGSLAGAELWALSALPGVGLMALGKWARGGVWTVLVSTAVLFASLDSDDPAIFSTAGRWKDIPPPPLTRAPAVALIAAALLLWALSIADTALQRRRLRSNRGARD